jgi:histone H3/H4
MGNTLIRDKETNDPTAMASPRTPVKNDPKPAQENVPESSTNSPHKKMACEPLKGAAKRKQKSKGIKKATRHMIPKAKFRNVVQDIVGYFSTSRDHLNVSRLALQALHESSEAYTTQFIADAMALNNYLALKEK